MALREFYEELPSTQERALVLARGGAADGTRVVARRQGDGRGRDGRRWASPPGGLYLSIVLRPAPLTPLLPLAVGAELAGALLERCGARLRLKWPNDLLAVGAGGELRKLGGILVDAVADASPSAVAGIGVNVGPDRDRLPPGVRGEAAALAEIVAATPSLESLEAWVADAALRARTSVLDRAADRALVARCRGLLCGVGEPLTVDGRPGGTLAGLADDGALVVLADGARRTVHAGHVRLGVGA